MKFLILKTSSLGDIIHAFTCLSYLREKFPHAQIDWVVEAPFADLVRAHPFIDNVLTVETKKWRKSLLTLPQIKSFYTQVRKNYYDAVFDLQGNLKSSFLLMLIKAKTKVGFGKKTVHEWPNLFFTNQKYDPPSGRNIREDNLYLLQRFLEDSSHYVEKEVRLNISKEEETLIDNLVSPHTHPVLVAPNAFWPNKELGLDQLEKFLKKIQNSREARDAFFFFSWGKQEERMVAEKLHRLFPEKSAVLPKLRLPVFQNLMRKVKLVVAMDSLPLHLCGTTKTPSFSFFGPSLGKKFIPLGVQHQFIQGPCPYGETFVKRCPRLRTCPTGACIKDIDTTK